MNWKTSTFKGPQALNIGGTSYFIKSDVVVFGKDTPTGDLDALRAEITTRAKENSGVMVLKPVFMQLFDRFGEVGMDRWMLENELTLRELCMFLHIFPEQEAEKNC